MNSYERYEAVCNLRQPDRVPVSPLIMTFAARLAGVKYSDYCRYGEVMASAQLQSIRRFGYDSVNVTSDAVRESETVGAPVIWQEDEVPGAPGDDSLIKGPDDLKKLRLPDPLGPNRMHEQIKALRILQRELGDGQVVYGWVEAPFQEAAMLRGLSNLMTDLYEHPKMVHALMRFATEMELAFGLAQVEAGARYIGVGDAVASLVSPRHYREYNFPYVSELISSLKKTGVRIKYHACGNTTALLPLFAELELDIINLDSLIDLKEAKAILGHKMCVKGNIDPARVMLAGTPEQVRAEVRRCLREGGMDGGFILSPGCELPRDTPYENLEALVAAADEYGRYPLKDSLLEG
ncbi:uroporphyrinogen decarboxylase family protein [Caldilinea sp.]|jgi:uroporphyrinogen decarboxylase|uniref:uroporphyrinogen decarboxylase family protein n=1 Tax=Caldilinea sp. TaxID=2293560 RepID=UPI0026281742|nr:uroporphyrinogen decarboxylase family protein [uncultured Caldilinea sp.]